MNQEKGGSKREKIQKLLNRHRNRYAHNQIPFEKAQYIQLIHNPVNRNQVITVQQVARLKSLDLGFKDQTKSQSADAQAQMQNLIMDQFLTDQMSKVNVGSDEKVLQDKGKGFFRFKYETCRSSGPQRNKDFTDPENTLDGLGDGQWDLDSVEDCCKHANTKSESCDCPNSREYLIVTIWTYFRGALEVEKEFIVESPIVEKDSVRPINISEQADCIFWFEKSADDKLV